MRRSLSVLLSAGLLGACRGHMPVPLTKPFSFPMSEAGRAVRELEQRRAEYLVGPDGWMYWQAVAQYRALAGDPAGALAAWDRPGQEDKGTAPDLSDVGPEDAVALLLREAERRQAFFINEAHHVPRHRAFTRSLLAGLRERGYRYFAAEAFSATDPDLASRGAPTRQTGGYVNEPQFAELVREALRLGFVPVPYEDDTPCDPPPGDQNFCANQRDRVQAENIKARVFDRDPRAKVLVHAGFDHIRKTGRPNWKTMAGVFRSLTGIDPLTVDQVEMTERSAPAFEKAAYRAALEAFKPAGSVVLAYPDGRGWVPAEDAGAYDFVVVHPRSALAGGRPDWVFADRSATPLPRVLCPAAPCTVEAYREADSPENDPPADAFVVRDASAAHALALTPGRYRVRVVAPDGVAKGDVLVEAR
ncbi:MAG: hypothetical protein FD126_1180 [Elusimicrobia bacterium]|nr:MAG: hypothetical protein FD126_1180 [Elusimicrobiota bacterium]